MPIPRSTVAVLLSLAVHAVVLGALCLLPSGEEPAGEIDTSGVTLDEGMILLGAGQAAQTDAASPPIDVNVKLLTAAPAYPLDTGPAAPAPAAPASPLATASPSGPGDPSSAPGGGERSGSGNGEGQRFFPAAGAGQSVVFVLDHSVSMGLGGALSSARRALLDALAHLPPGVRFQVVVYSSSARFLGPIGFLTKDETTLREITLALEELEPSGTTNHVQALRCALSLKPDVLYLVTDAEQVSDAEVDLIGRLNAQLTQGHTAIHAIELRAGREAPDARLRRVALLNHGTYRRLAPTP